MRVTVSAAQVEAAFEAVKDDPSFDESRGLWERGQPPVEMIQAMCLRPEILRAFAGFGGAVYPGGILERRVKELVIITASQRNDCQFCTNSLATWSTSATSWRSHSRSSPSLGRCRPGSAWRSNTRAQP
jgi:alkylhydroperoxidase family enzyme